MSKFKSFCFDLSFFLLIVFGCIFVASLALMPGYFEISKEGYRVVDYQLKEYPDLIYIIKDSYADGIIRNYEYYRIQQNIKTLENIKYKKNLYETVEDLENEIENKAKRGYVIKKE